MVLSYDQKQQQNFLEKLNLDAHDWQDLLMLLTLGMVSLICLLALIVFARKNKKSDPRKILWHLFFRKLATKGIFHKKNEGPISFAHRIAQTRPDLAKSTEIICQQYSDLQYSEKSSTTSIKALQKAIKSFKP